MAEKNVLVCSDLDGTFLATDKSIPEMNLRLLDALYERNIPFVPITGRSLAGIPEEIYKHPAVQFAVGSNGATIFDVKKNEMVHKVGLSKETVLRLYDELKDREVTFDIYADGKAYAERPRYDMLDTFDIDPYNLKTTKELRTPLDIKVPEMLEQFSHLERITTIWKHIEDRDLITRLVSEDPNLHLTSSGKVNFEISDVNATKGHAVEWLAEYYGVSLADTIVFGDSHNDTTMVSLVGHGVAVENAIPEILEAATYHTVSNDDAGVAFFLKEMLELTELEA